MLNRLWFGFFLVAAVAALTRWLVGGDEGVFTAVVGSLFDMADLSVKVMLLLFGTLTLWLGFLRIAEQAGLVDHLARMLGPLFVRLMPGVPRGHPAIGLIMLNFAANALGLDNAATPIGLRAMRELQTLNPSADTASNAQILFLVLNASSLTLLPVTVFMYRAQAGAHEIGFQTQSPPKSAAARAAHGPARLLVNCAGIGNAGRILGRDGPLALSAFEQVIRVNLIGTFNMLRLAAADMAGLDPLGDDERGIVVNTASIAAYEGQVGQAAYAASKAGVVGLTLPAAREFARVGIRVVTIAPGLIETPMFNGLPDEVRRGLAASVPFPSRLGLPAEYAALVLHIAANRFLNGETIRLDGALRMAPR